MSIKSYETKSKALFFFSNLLRVNDNSKENTFISHMAFVMMIIKS